MKDVTDVVQNVCQKHGSIGWELARDEADAQDLWSDRKNAHYAGMSLVPGAKGWSTDVW